jgi:ribonuclease HII
MRSRRSSTPPEQACFDWSREGLVAGVDEAGRGPLAGPVVAAAVILDDRRPIAGLADSKQLTPLRRERLFEQIRAQALCCSIAQASVEEIDRLNILQATMLAMQRAVAGLRLRPRRVLVDGNRLPVLDVQAEAIVGGDARVPASRPRRSWPRCTATNCASNCTRTTRPTDSTPTRATARRSIWRRCASMAPARRTGAALLL